MSTERATVSHPDDVRRAAQRIAEERGTSFSAVVAEALTGWMRGRLVDAWLAEHQASGAPVGPPETVAYRTPGAVKTRCTWT